MKPTKPDRKLPEKCDADNSAATFFNDLDQNRYFELEEESPEANEESGGTEIDKADHRGQ